jgi:hypothetical protein
VKHFYKKIKGKLKSTQVQHYFTPELAGEPCTDFVKLNHQILMINQFFASFLTIGPVSRDRIFTRLWSPGIDSKE